MQEDRGAAYRMAKEYDLNIQDAQKMLKQAREVPEIMKASRKYQDMLKERGVHSKNND